MGEIPSFPKLFVVCQMQKLSFMAEKYYVRFVMSVLKNERVWVLAKFQLRLLFHFLLNIRDILRHFELQRVKPPKIPNICEKNSFWRLGISPVILK